MKDKRRKKIKKNNEKSQRPTKDINDIIDELAYANDSDNILKSKKFLEDIYILKLE